ncbi:MAG TPA: PAC2 family protein [Actinomycetes bacterium]|nr:PAC2 family protein [Actinomycetes bacterium]
MLDPHSLIQLDPDLPELDGVVLLHALSGFVDAGAGVRLSREHLLRSLEHRVLARFDVDQLLDYRARRPLMSFVEDHWESYPEPTLALHLVHDQAGTPFLLLTGPEPDIQWERVVAAVRTLIDRFGVRLTIGLTAIPMAVPHTRPVGVTAHATRRELTAGRETWVSRVEVPASIGHLLEWRLGEAGRDAIGFAVHVPHYVAQIDYPGAAVALLEAAAKAGGLMLPTGELVTAAETTLAQVEEQVRSSDEVAAVVHGLEAQYDAYVGARAGTNLLASDGTPLPTADELGAELERFLADQARRHDEGEAGGSGEPGLS